MPQNKEINSNSRKNKSLTPVPADWVAKATGTSVSTVFSIRNGTRNTNGKKGQSIEVAEMLLAEQREVMIAVVKNICPL